MPHGRPWHANLAQWSAAVEPVAETFVPLDTQPPLTLAELEKLEKALARPLPHSLRRFALEDAAAVKFYWMLPEDYELPDAFQELNWGQIELDLRDLPNMEKHRLDWVAQVFPNPDDPIDAPWHHSLAFHHLDNGDLLAFDLSADPNDPPVIYLSHEGEAPTRLGHNFADFLDRFTRLGCPGPECWLLEPFLTGTPPMLDPTCPAARDWRSHFKLPN